MKSTLLLLVVLWVVVSAHDLGIITFSAISPLKCPSGIVPFPIENSLCKGYVRRGCCPLDPAVTPDPTSTTTSISATLSTLSLRCMAALQPLICETMCAPHIPLLLQTLNHTFTGTQQSMVDDALSIACPTTCALIQAACVSEVPIVCPTSTEVADGHCIGSGFPTALAMGTDVPTPVPEDGSERPNSRSISIPSAFAPMTTGTNATCFSSSCLTPAQKINTQGWSFLAHMLSQLDAYLLRPHAPLEYVLSLLRAEASPNVDDFPFSSSTSIAWFAAGVVMLILVVLSNCCVRTAPRARVSPDLITCHIAPPGVLFDAAVSQPYLGAEEPPEGTSSAELAEVGHLQRGQLLARPLLVRAWLAFLGALTGAVVWILVVLSPLFMSTVQGTILGYGALPPDLFACAVAVTLTLTIMHVAYGKIGDRTFVSITPLAVSIIAGVLAVPILAFFLARAATCIDRNGFASASADMDCDGAAITMICSAVWLIIVAYLTLYAAKMWGFGKSQPGIMNQPGLPVVFSETHQRFLLAYLDASSMNLKPEKAAQLTLAEARRSSAFAGSRVTPN